MKRAPIVLSLPNAPRSCARVIAAPDQRTLTARMADAVQDFAARKGVAVSAVDWSARMVAAA